jgi:hypothetical protein
VTNDHEGDETPPGDGDGPAGDEPPARWLGSRPAPPGPPAAGPSVAASSAPSATAAPAADEVSGPGPRVPAGRKGVRWTYALGVSLLAFGVWLVLDAPTLQHNATVNVVGTRRTVSLDLLGPIAAFSRTFQLSRVVSVGDRIIGREGNQPGNGVGPVTLGPRVHPTSKTTRSRAGSKSGTEAVAKTGPTAPVSTTPTTLSAMVQPTPSNPLRVLIIGDSLGIDLGQQLQNDLADTNVVEATLDAEIETGLTRPDYFNWPVELQTDVNKIDPQVIVIMIGANDAQDFPGPPDIPYGTPQWNALYSQRVAQFMQIGTSEGAKVIWVGMPPMQDPTLDARMMTINQLQQAMAAHAPGVTYQSTWTLLGTPQGQYTPNLDIAGQQQIVREPDGTHIAPPGAEFLSQVVIGDMRAELHIPVPA